MLCELFEQVKPKNPFCDVKTETGKLQIKKLKNRNWNVVAEKYGKTETGKLLLKNWKSRNWNVVAEKYGKAETGKLLLKKLEKQKLESSC